MYYSDTVQGVMQFCKSEGQSHESVEKLLRSAEEAHKILRAITTAVDFWQVVPSSSLRQRIRNAERELDRALNPHEHEWSEWSYTYNPAGTRACLKCGRREYG